MWKALAWMRKFCGPASGMGRRPGGGAAASGHRVGRVLGQVVAGGRDPTEAALRPPGADPNRRPDGRAGCGVDDPTGGSEGGRERGGYRGPIQGNRPEMEAAVRLWRRGHWEIEHWLHGVRDGSFGEDRRQGRPVGPGLRRIRNVALNRLRTLGDRFGVDGFRAFSAWLDRGLSLRIRPKP